ncbi:MAG: hypothetical protein ACRDXE_01580, partial [Acidimicrobiales bacterium]
MAAKQIYVTGQWAPGSTGIVLFRPSTPLVDTSTGPTTRYGTALREAVLNAGAQIGISLVATDDPAIAPTGQTWSVIEVINGHREDPYDVIIPAAAAGGTIDIHSLTPVSGPQAPVLYGGGGTSNAVSVDQTGGNAGFATQSKLPPPVQLINLQSQSTSWSIKGIAVPKMVAGATFVARSATVRFRFGVSGRYLGGGTIGFSLVVANNGGQANTPMIAGQGNASGGFALAAGVTDLRTPLTTAANGYGQYLCSVGDGQEGLITAGSPEVVLGGFTVGTTYSVQAWAQPYQPVTYAVIGPGPKQMAISGDGKTLFISNGTYIKRVDLGRRPLWKVTGTYPDGLATPPPGRSIGQMYASQVPALLLAGGAASNDIWCDLSANSEWGIVSNGSGTQHSVTIFNSRPRYYGEVQWDSGSTTLRGTFQTADLGRPARGPGIPAGATITALVVGTATISAATVAPGNGLWLDEWIQATVTGLAAGVNNVTISPNGRIAWASLVNGVCVPIALPVYGSRTDAGATVTSGSATVTDAAITAADVGRPTGGNAGIPANTYVGTVTPGVSYTLANAPFGGAAVLATATGASVRIGTAGAWDPAVAGTGFTLPHAAPGGGGIRYSQDGTTIAVADFNNGTLELFNATTFAHTATATLGGGGGTIGAYRVQASSDNTFWVGGYYNDVL